MEKSSLGQLTGVIAMLLLCGVIACCFVPAPTGFLARSAAVECALWIAVEVRRGALGAGV